MGRSGQLPRTLPPPVAPHSPAPPLPHFPSARKRRRSARLNPPSLWDAIRNDDIDRCLELLSEGAATPGALGPDGRLLANGTTTIDADDRYSAGLMSPLMLAIMLERVAIVKLLLSRGADSNWARPHNGVTSARIAARLGQAEVMRVLAEHGAILETPDNHGTTPAHIAAQEGHAEVMRVLAELGANIETPANDGTTPAFIAAWRGHADVINEIAKARSHLVNQTVVRGGNPPMSLLAIAVMQGHCETARALLLLGAPVTAHELKQRTGPNAPGDARQLRADIQSWAATALAQHRTFGVFLHGCSAHEGIALSKLGGVEGVRVHVGAFVGVVVGDELRRLRAGECQPKVKN